jgi:formylmethanofuran--tetrahydromethanopterin N-formyltransferase
MEINGVTIDDTFAEAFPMKATRVLITSDTAKWAHNAALAATGCATSVIGCGVEAGIERTLSAKETPDGRPGVSILLFAVSSKELARQLERRVGQCILTAPGSAAYAGIDSGEALPLGKNLRYFGDGFQASKLIGEKRYWRVPVMDGEFVCQETTGMVKAVGGGNFLVLARSRDDALSACEAAVHAARKVRNIIMPFPGGVVRSGSKVGSKYKTLPASTNDAFCPTLRGVVKTELAAEVGSVLEIVIDGLAEQDVRAAMRAGIAAVCERGAARGVLRVTAGNYGGKLGPFHFHLREILA